MMSAESTQGSACALLLGWVAVCDAPLNRAEAATLARIFEDSSALRSHLSATLNLLEELDHASLARACAEVCSLNERNRRALLGLAIRVVLADGAPKPAESHALRLVADLCVLGSGGETELAAQFRAVAGRALPPIGDPSSIDWWTEHEARQPAGLTAYEAVDAGDSIRRIVARAVLGLETDATPVEVQDRYRDLSKMLHPDKFHGRAEMQAIAQRLFTQLTEARDVLLDP